jgi:putative transposase
MLPNQYNWCLGDRISQDNQQFMQGEYCDLRTKAIASTLRCFVSTNGATGEAWKQTKDGSKKPRSRAVDIQITALPQLKVAKIWYAEINETVLQQNLKLLDVAGKNFFEGRGFTKFKNRSSFTSFTYVMEVKVQASKIYLPQLGWMRFDNYRLILDGFVIKAATVRQQQDWCYVSLRIEDKTIPALFAKPLADVKSFIGCDFIICRRQA